MEFLRRIVRLAVLGLVLASILMGGVAVAGKKTPLAGPFVSPAAGGPGKSGPVKPGKGCGDKNHYHERESQCKKPPK